MHLDVGTFFRELTKRIRSDADFATSVSHMLESLQDAVPHRSWKKILALNYTKDAKRASGWIPAVLSRDPCPFPIRGLYCGLAEMGDDNGAKSAELYVGFLGQYDAADRKREWLFGKKRYYPQPSVFKTKLLTAAGDLFRRTRDEDFTTVGRYAFPLVYASLLVKSILTPELHGQLGAPKQPVGVVTGWDSGDFLHIGELAADGFRPLSGRMI